MNMDQALNQSKVFKPMLAHSYEQYKHKIQQKIAIQPKLDGIRCLAVKENGSIKLFSRNGKEFTSAPHIIQSLEQGPDFHILDGELYNHNYRQNFEFITHLVRQKLPDQDYKEIEYHIFDAVLNQDFIDRYQYLQQFHDLTYIKLVDTRLWTDHSYIEEAYDVYKEKGYEGIIIRNWVGFYEQGRSSNLFKYKKFQEAEFQIVDVISGQGKLAGHGIFVLQTKEGNQFTCKMEGSLDNLREYLDNKDRYISKFLTVQYQDMSNTNKVPRFGIGKAIRDYE